MTTRRRDKVRESGLCVCVCGGAQGACAWDGRCGRGRTRFPEYRSLVPRDPARASTDRESKIQMERKGAPGQDEMFPFDQ